jgi:hypothetical protein
MADANHSNPEQVSPQSSQHSPDKVQQTQLKTRIAALLLPYFLIMGGIVWYTAYSDPWSFRERVLYFVALFTGMFFVMFVFGRIARRFVRIQVTGNGLVLETALERVLYSFVLVSLVTCHSIVKAYRKHDTSELAFLLVLFPVLVLLLFVYKQSGAAQDRLAKPTASPSDHNVNR